MEYNHESEDVFDACIIDHDNYMKKIEKLNKEISGGNRRYDCLSKKVELLESVMTKRELAFMATELTRILHSVDSFVSSLPDNPDDIDSPEIA